MVLDAPLDDRTMRRTVGTRTVKSGEAIRLSLKVDHSTDIAERAIHIDDDCALTVHSTLDSSKHDVAPRLPKCTDSPVRFHTTCRYPALPLHDALACPS